MKLTAKNLQARIQEVWPTLSKGAAAEIAVAVWNSPLRDPRHSLNEVVLGSSASALSSEERLFYLMRIAFPDYRDETEKCLEYEKESSV